MKTRLSILCLVLAFVMCLSACDTESDTADDTHEQKGTSSVVEKDITELKPGDTVSIVGEVACYGLVNNDTIWVQVQQADRTFVIYHCHLKSEFLSRAEKFETFDIVKVKGFFLSLMDLEKEYTSPVVTLYDCELVE